MKKENVSKNLLNADNFKRMMPDCPKRYGNGGYDLTKVYGWGDYLGYQRTNMSAMIHGKRSVPDDVLARIVAASGCSARYLLGETRYRTENEEMRALLAEQLEKTVQKTRENISLLAAYSEHQNVIEKCLIDNGVNIECVKQDGMPDSFMVNGVSMDALQYGRYLALMDKALTQASESYFETYTDIIDSLSRVGRQQDS